jgi:hypothetical protein
MQVASGATLKLKNLTIADGFASDHTNGGGIANDGTLTVTNSTVSDNIASLGNGGGISSNGTLTVTKSTFSNNGGLDGGGILSGGTLTITNSTFSDNVAHFGGAIESGPLTVITNSTFSGNGAFAGGAIDSGGTLTVTSSTFSDNDVANFGSASFKNTILAGGQNCFLFGQPITDAGYNISSDTTCGFAKTGSANNGDGIDPLLSTDGLANNGGPTETIALVSGSPAIDAIPVADCTDQASPPKAITTDQRGMPRPDPGEDVCDIGAYESQESFAGEPGRGNCHGVSVSMLAQEFGSIDAAASVLGFSSVKALQNAIREFCKG